MLEFDGVLGFLLLGLWIWAILDVIMTDESTCRNLPKFGWLFLVLILPDIGAIAWLIAGRPQGTTFEPGSTRNRQWDARLDARAGGHLTERERLRLERERWLADMDNELDRRLEARAVSGDESAETERLRRWEADLEAREAELRRRENGPA